jgi:hypothetical protein
MANLFKAAKANPEKKAASKEKVVVQVDYLSQEIERLAKIQEEIDALNAEAKLLHEQVKEAGVNEFINLFESSSKYPGSFNIESDNASVMFIPSDRYTKIDEERSNELIEKYGEGMVEESTTYIMDSALVEKYGDVISDLITNSKKIEKADKEKLISAKVDYSIAKGTISSLNEYNLYDMKEIISDIKPVFMLKNPKIS